MSRVHLGTSSIFALAAVLATQPAHAQSASSDAVALPALTVTETVGMGDVSQSVTAQPANTTVVNSKDIASEPVSSYGDIFRPLAGFNISNYSQGIIGYGLTLRGFTDAEHGRDISYFIDGIPINEVSSLHTPNYADLNVLIPETVDHIDIIRGPFSVEYGDSNVGGSVNIVTKDSEPSASIGVSGGSFGTLRGIGTYSSTTGSVLPFAAFEGDRSSGYANNSFTEHFNAFLKTTFMLEGGAQLSVRAQAYEADGGAAGYISQQQLQEGLINNKTAVNPTDGSKKTMENLVANYKIGAPDQEFDATLYVNHDKFDRWADFGGGQTAQDEDRTIVGGNAKKIWTISLAGMPSQLLVGVDWRTDFIDALQAPSIARVPNYAAETLNLGITQTDLASFTQLQIKPTQWLKLTGGARFDQFDYQVDNRLTPSNSPNASPNVFDPKAGISITPVSWAEIFANYGDGFRSPNATSDLLSNPAVKPFTLSSEEAGVRLTFDRVTLLGDVWQTDINNEVYQAAPGLPVQNIGKSRRQGVDLEGKVYAVKSADLSLAFFANYSPTQARLLGQGTAIYVPSVPQSLANFGVEFDKAMGNKEHLTGTAYVTFVGKKYLDEDGSIITSPYSRLSTKLAYTWNNGWNAFAQATWYPGNLNGEAAFNFGNNTGATAADIYVRPVPRFTAMAGATYRFATAGL